MNNKKVFLLIDFDAFFISCHAIENKYINEVPAVVGDNSKKGIVITSNYKARSLGIKTAMPLYKVKKIYKDILIIEPDMDLYSKVSKEAFKEISENFTKKIEIVSIDECYLEVSDCYKKYGSVVNMANEIREFVKSTFNLTCSIGISSNKFLSKMASEFNKPDGVTKLLPNEIEKKLWPLDIEKMYGVGKATVKKFEDSNISKIGDLAKQNRDDMIQLLGKHGLNLWINANGLGEDEINPSYYEINSIGNEWTLKELTNNEIEIEDYLRDLTRMVCNRAKKRLKKAKTVSIIVIYKDFENKLSKNRNRKQVTLKSPSNEFEEIYPYVEEMFYSFWNYDLVKLLGVKLSNLVENFNIKKQLEIKDIDTINKQDRIESIIDVVNNSFDKKLLMTGSNLIEHNEKYSDNYKYSKVEKENRKK